MPLADFRFTQVTVDEHQPAVGERAAWAKQRTLIALEVLDTGNPTFPNGYSSARPVVWRPAEVRDLLELAELLRSKYTPPVPVPAGPFNPDAIDGP